jgi:hypothetical protein
MTAPVNFSLFSFTQPDRRPSRPRARRHMACWLALYCWLPYGALDAVAQTPACEPCHAIAPSQPFSTVASVAPEPIDAQSERQEKGVIARALIDRFRLKPKLANRIVAAVYSEAQARGLPPSLVLAIIAAESGFDPAATSTAGACGLMQVLPRYHRLLVKQLAPDANLYFPENNIRIGTAILQRYITVTAGDLDAALSSYSGGSAGYAARVHARWTEFNRIVNSPALLRQQPPILISQDR